MGLLLLITILLIVMIITGVLAILLKEMLASIIVFSTFSFFAVLIYLVMGAPDVAFTEAVIGIVTTMFFMAALTQVRKEDEK
ncbi:MAG: DUF4040 domain-containing protein [Clostridiales bacterium]|nr:DUF4040 domain-containing protein [Clostridiales bacterium]